MSPVSTKPSPLAKSAALAPKYRLAAPVDLIRSEPSSIFISSSPRGAPRKEAGKPSRSSSTSKPTPASVEA